LLEATRGHVGFPFRSQSNVLNVFRDFRPDEVCLACLERRRTKFEAVEAGEEATRPSTHAAAHRKEILQLKRLLAEKTMEVDFFKGALQKVDARRRRSDLCSVSFN
jgi:hypothetical protein